MRCEFSFNGNKCAREATKVLKTSGDKYMVCAKHYRKWNQRIPGSMLAPNEYARNRREEGVRTMTHISWRCNEVLMSWSGRGLWRWTSWAHPKYHIFYEIKDSELWEWM